MKNCSRIALSTSCQSNTDVNKILANQAYAYKAIQLEDKIGTMLPCSVIIQELDNNVIEVAAVDPVASMMAIENPDLAGIAKEIKEKLERVIAAL